MNFTKTTPGLRFSLRAMLVCIALFAAAFALPTPLNVLAPVCVLAGLIGLALAYRKENPAWSRTKTCTVTAGAVGGLFVSPIVLIFEGAPRGYWPGSGGIFAALGVARSVLLGCVIAYVVCLVLAIQRRRDQNSKPRFSMASLMLDLVLLGTFSVAWNPVWFQWQEPMAVSRVSYAFSDGNIALAQKRALAARHFPKTVNIVAFYAKAGADEQTRLGTLQTLAMIWEKATKDPVLKPLLEELCEDKSDQVRLTAKELLEKLGDGPRTR